MAPKVPAKRAATRALGCIQWATYGSGRPVPRVTDHNIRTPRYGSDLVVDVLNELGIEYAAFNPGSSFRGLHDSLVNYAAGQPGIVQCTHEEISVAVAHGYAKAARRPMAAIVHNIVGLQHASMGIFNAWCDRVPVLVLGGTGPVDAARRRPWIDWIHTANVQGSLVRDFTKWDDQPSSLAALVEALIRAFTLATMAPRAPVYVCLDVDLQEQEIPKGFTTPEVHSFSFPAPVSPDFGSLAELAGWLIDSNSPVVLTDRAGRSQKAGQMLVELAELLALPVLEGQHDVLSFPTRHPLNLAGDHDLLAGADLVLGIECEDLFGTLETTERLGRGARIQLRPDLRVVAISPDLLIARGWAGDHQRMVPSALTIPVESEACLGALVPLCRQLLQTRPARREPIERRRRELQERSARRWQVWERRAVDSNELTRELLALQLWKALKGESFLLASGTLGGWTHRLWDMREPGQYLGSSGAAGLGYAPGAAIGAALACRGSGRIVVNLQSDGDLLYTASALWTMAHERMAILTIMYNNRAYQNSVDHAEQVAVARGRPVENKGIGNLLTDPAVDFASLARSLGLYAAGPIAEPDAVLPAIRSALRIVREEGRPALVDVVTAG